MRINSINKSPLFFGSKEIQETKKPDMVSNSPDVADSSSCMANYNRASVADKRSENKYAVSKAQEAVQKVLKEDEVIKDRTNLDLRSGEKIVRMYIGKPVDGFEGLYDDSRRAACYFDDKGDVKNIFVLDVKTGETDIYDASGKNVRHFTKEEKDALYYYKYHPDAIHYRFREGREIYSGAFLKEAHDAADTLDEIFNNPDKVFYADSNLTLYRALQRNLSEEDKAALSTNGAIFEDKSYCSATTNLEVAQRFSCGNPILQIEFPKNSKYMDVERLFNIERRHWSEQEVLLDRNSSFLITGYDSENNIVKSIYTG